MTTRHDVEHTQRTKHTAMLDRGTWDMEHGTWDPPTDGHSLTQPHDTWRNARSAQHTAMLDLTGVYVIMKPLNMLLMTARKGRAKGRAGA